MSKFFRALEMAERERAARARGADAVEPTEAADSGKAGVDEARPTEPAPASPAAPPVPSVTAAVVAPRRASGASHRSAFGAPLRGDGPRGRASADPAEETLLWNGSGEVDEHLISVLEPTGPVAEQYRAVRLHLEKLSQERGVAVVAVTSARRGDGRTLTALNIAGTLGQAPDARVVVVEADLRRPSISRYLGRSNAVGLSTYLVDTGVSIDAILDRLPGTAFSVIPGGPSTSMPYELLKSSRLGDMVATLRQRFSHVIVDTPPVLGFPDVGILRDFVDGMLLVVRAHRTPREQVREALVAIGQDRALGVVFNDAQGSGRIARAGVRV